MKTYRIQVRYADQYWDFKTKADSVDDAGQVFVNKVKDGSLRPVGEEPLYRGDICFITHEEVADATKPIVRQET